MTDSTQIIRQHDNPFLGLSPSSESDRSNVSSKRTMGSMRYFARMIIIILATCFAITSLFRQMRVTTSQFHESTDPQVKPSTSSFALVLVPDKCNSTSRGHFDKIYAQDLWGGHLRSASDFYSDAAWPPNEIRKVSASGKGSDLGINTQTSLKIVKDAINRYNVKSMIDIPCGDANWIFDSLITDTLPLYLGLDVTSAVIQVNKERFAHHKNKLFSFWDATTCSLPKFQNGTNGELTPFDLVHVRDVIQHMRLEQGVSFFCNVFHSGARVLVATTYPDNTKNVQITEGSWYKNNLFLDPFNFPNVTSCSPTHPEEEPDYTCVYDLTEPWVKDFVSSKC